MHDDTTQLTSNLPYPRSDANKVTNGLPESYQQNHSPTTRRRIVRHRCSSAYLSPLITPSLKLRPGEAVLGLLMLTRRYHMACSAATDNGNVKHMANINADPVQRRSRKTAACRRNAARSHTVGIVTWLAFRPFDLPTANGQTVRFLDIDEIDMCTFYVAIKSSQKKVNRIA